MAKGLEFDEVVIPNDHKRRLIDSFINTIYLYDDKMVITFNYKDGSETVSLSEIENSDLSSDLTASALPKIKFILLGGLDFFVSGTETR